MERRRESLKDWSCKKIVGGWCSGIGLSFVSEGREIHLRVFHFRFRDGLLQFANPNDCHFNATKMLKTILNSDDDAPEDLEVS